MANENSNSTLTPQTIFNILKEKTTWIDDHGYEAVLPDGLLWSVTHELYNRFRRELKNAKNQ